ncbi:hypothetical protein EWM64_g4527 [Hericium alpestre]|uniref:Uncharacterized protein n=1 Tax=Hericium alpestre TaxID=135208 RepID=A0A4Y9ZZ66_9AGAM|nr:hypothetical protein EWM64_g4527 [Hericium alpestre]
MSQSYFASRKHNPVEEVSTGASPELQLKDVQEAYVEHKDRLLHAIDSAKSILGDLRIFNKEAWVVRYPQLREKTEEVDAGSKSGPRRKSLRRSLSFADDPSHETDVVVTPRAKGLTRSLTLASIADALEETQEETAVDEGERLVTPTDAADFHVFRLDLKLGAHGSSNSPASLCHIPLTRACAHSCAALRAPPTPCPCLPPHGTTLLSLVRLSIDTCVCMPKPKAKHTCFLGSPSHDAPVPFDSPVQYDLPVGLYECDGWCKPWEGCGSAAGAVVSLSSCSDLQQSWESDVGSMTTMRALFRVHWAMLTCGADAM